MLEDDSKKTVEKWHRIIVGNSGKKKHVALLYFNVIKDNTTQLHYNW